MVPLLAVTSCRCRSVVGQHRALSFGNCLKSGSCCSQLQHTVVLDFRAGTTVALNRRCGSSSGELLSSICQADGRKELISTGRFCLLKWARPSPPLIEEWHIPFERYNGCSCSSYNSLIEKCEQEVYHTVYIPLLYCTERSTRSVLPSTGIRQCQIATRFQGVCLKQILLKQVVGTAMTSCFQTFQSQGICAIL